MFECEFKIGHQDDTCCQEIGLRVQHMLVILDATAKDHFWGGLNTDDHLITQRIFVVTINRI
jgi:hypothetical protein